MEQTNQMIQKGNAELRAEFEQILQNTMSGFSAKLDVARGEYETLLQKANVSAVVASLYRNTDNSVGEGPDAERGGSQ